MSGCSASSHGRANAGGASGSGASTRPGSGAPIASGSVSGSPGTADPRLPVPVPVDPSTALAPPEFAHPAAWSTSITLSRNELALMARGGDPKAPLTDWALADDQLSTGLTALAGEVVVLPTFTSNGTEPNATASLTLRFVDVKTGTQVASQPMPDATFFYGMDAVSIGGKPAVEVRYQPKVPAVAGHPTRFTSVVFDTAGKQLWTSAGQQMSGGAAGPDPGLVGDMSSGLVRDGGYLVHRNSPDANDPLQRRGSVSVLDFTGRTLLTVPDFAVFNQADPNKNIRNGLQLIGGYAVVTVVDPAAAAPAAAPGEPGIPVRFTVYDLVHGGKKVASVAEPAVDPTTQLMGWGRVLADCGGKMLLHWPMTRSGKGGGTNASLAVLDTATGRTSAPITFPTQLSGALEASFRAVTDPSCSAVDIAGTFGVADSVALAVNWADGRTLWQQLVSNPPYQPAPHSSMVSPATVHGGTVYGWQQSSAGLPQAASFGLADGKSRGGGFSLMPVAFTSDGSPVFLQIDGANSATATAPTTPSASASPIASPTVSRTVSPTRPAGSPTPDLYSVTVWVGKPTG